MMEIERTIGRLVSAGTYLSIAIVAAGVAAMLLTGRSPLDPDVAPFDPSNLGRQLAAPEALLWIGLGVAIATPAAGVAAALIGFLAQSERTLAAIAAAILAVIAVAVVVALGTG